MSLGGRQYKQDTYMTQNSFTIGEALRVGWETTKKNLGFLLVVFVIVFTISIFVGIIQQQVKDSVELSLAIRILNYVVQLFVGIGLASISLKLIDGKKASFEDLYSHYNLVLNYAVASILYGLIVLAGYILLIVPGIVWTIKYQFYSYFVVDKGMGPLEAIKASGRATQGHKMHLFGFSWVALGVMILGLIAVFVGLLVAVPVVMLATAYIYRRLSA